MSWLNRVRQSIPFIAKRETPDNLWIKCPDTGQMVFHKDVEANDWVIPGSNHHMRLDATQRLKATFDSGTWIDVPLPPAPVSVSSRVAARSRSTSSSSCARPTKRVRWTGTSAV